MAGRKRQIDPEYPFEEEIAQLSIPARYFYALSWCHMDDTNSVLPYNTYKLKGLIFPKDDVDVEALIQELVTMKRLFPFEADGKNWLWCPALQKHQVINHPSRKKYPDPPKALREGYRSTTVALPQSRVERVEKSRVELKEQPEAAKLLNEVSKNGLNIYQLINKVKKQLKWSKKQEFPPEVIEAVCRQYLKDKDKVKSKWPWFLTVIRAESAAHFARKSVTEGQKWKEAPIPDTIKALIKGMGME